MAKKGKLGMIQEYPKVIQNRCRELGLIQESSDKLTKRATIGKMGFFNYLPAYIASDPLVCKKVH